MRRNALRRDLVRGAGWRLGREANHEHHRGYEGTRLFGLCIARCGSIASVEDGRFTRLDPDPTHPTGQALCAKGRAAPELVYSKERPTRPRTRPKLSSSFSVLASSQMCSREG